MVLLRRRSTTEDTTDSAVRAGAAAAEAAHATAPARPPGENGRPIAIGAAFFDLDNTVMRGASIFHLARGLYARRFLGTRDIARFGLQQLRFRLGGEHMGDVDDAQDRALSFVAGYSVDEIRAIGEEIFDEFMSDKIWPGTRALAQMHLDAGRQVWLVTAAPVEIATTIADRLGLTGALGTVPETRAGVYTGRLVGELLHGEAKAEAVRALAIREDLDLTDCSAYSDSANDIPMLMLVGDPCAVNPDARLRRHAREHGWRIKDYRTGRKAARIGLPAAAGVGAVAGAVVASTAVRRRAPHRI
ncbi:HAD-IB family hydrolase [Streptomyces sp. SID3343]|uniref:HAD family hydrolase n=1 Tax=Streptomyces sp. SID3343 TaxID=2690260 RepID=UPI001368B415|nr:HAD-IB family hydrolase [Streptomyces sp. SID3343]MYV99471.1 HAD-IB family hydrolase [Streptomyces sp. SID3343]